MPELSHRHRVAVVRWASHEVQPGPAILDDAQRIPGVVVASASPLTVLLPRSTWELPVVRTLLAGVELPQCRAPRPADELFRGLYAHQQCAVEFLLEHDGGILADQMGLGKTRAALVAARTWQQEHPRKPPVLIVAPRYTRETWRREIDALGIAGGGFWAIESVRPTSATCEYDADWWFIHYEVLHAWVSHLSVNRRGRPVCVLLDEAHWVRNARTKRGKAAQLVSHLSGKVVALTGTPLANRPSDLWALLQAVDGPKSWGHPLEFRQRYCGATHNGFGWEDGQPTFVDELQTRLRTRYLRRTIDDAGVELPSITRVPVYVDLTDQEVEKHAEVLDSLFAGASLEDLYSLLTSSAASKQTLEALHALRQQTTSAKFGTTVEYVSSLVQQDERVVVFVWQRKMAERLARALRKTTAVALVHGGLSQAVREARVREFQDGGPEDFRVLVSTLDALKEGVTLHCARHVVLHDLAWNPSDVLQAEARVYRIGQKRPVTSAWVLAKDSFDTLLARALLRKSATQDALLEYDDAQRVMADVGLAEEFVASLEQEGMRLLAQWKARQE